MPIPAALVGPALLEGGTGAIVAEVAAALALEIGLEAIGDAVAGYFGSEGIADIPTTPPATLINNIEFKPVIDVNQDNKDRLHAAAKVINEDSANVTQLKNKLYADAVAANADANAKFNAFDGDQRRAADKLLNQQTDVKKALPDDAAKTVKQLERKRVDRYYVSQEYSEYKYNIKARVIGGVPTLSPIALWAQAGDGQIVSDSPTYGEWVDAKEFRKAGELYRRLVRATTCDGGKQLLTLAGTTQAALLASLIAIPANKLVFTDAVANTPWLIPD